MKTKRKPPGKKQRLTCAKVPVHGRKPDNARAEVPPPVNLHPGELLRLEFMEPLGLTAEKVAKAIPPHPDRGLTRAYFAEQIADMLRADEDSSLDLYLALALDRYFGLAPGYFWRAQAAYEIRDEQHREREWLARVRPLKLATRKLTPAELASLAAQLPGASKTKAAALKKQYIAGFYGKIPGRRKRVLEPEFAKMMAGPPGDDARAAIDEDRGAASYASASLTAAEVADASKRMRRASSEARRKGDTREVSGIDSLREQRP